MEDMTKYKIPDEYFFRLHHVRPRFKNQYEDILLYVATSISEMGELPKKDFDKALNDVLSKFGKNKTSKDKTINNWRTEISALFALIQTKDEKLFPSSMAARLANNQYLDEFFNYFLYTFQYPGGHTRPDYIKAQIKADIKFKPCEYILNILIEGEKLLNKPFSITAEELTQCAYYDLRVTRDGRSPKEIAELILSNRDNSIEYDCKHKQLKNKKTGKIPSRGDIYRYAGDILDYMVLANLLSHKGTGYYYLLNDQSKTAIEYHINKPTWYSGYDQFSQKHKLNTSNISEIEEKWFDYANSYTNIKEFSPQLNSKEIEDISSLIQEYYSHLKGGKKVPTKILGDYGETLILAHEYLRTKDKSKRQHLINKIPTHLGVGYDIQSIEIEKNKRYIEVKSTKSKKAISKYQFKLTPNEWDTAETMGDRYFIYYLVVNEGEKKVFTIQDPVKKHNQGKLKVDKNLVVNFSNNSGKWQRLLEICN